MGWEDRSYYRDRGGQPSSGNPLAWIAFGSVPLFTVFRIRVRAHAMLLMFAGVTLIFGFGLPGFSWQDRITYVAMLFGIVLLHEFGHCFTARWVGGEAEDILMHPLGGLAFARAPHRPLPTFLTVAGGPAVNVVICVVCAIILWLAGWSVPLNPFRPSSPLDYSMSATSFYAGYYAFWVFHVSFFLLIFNLLPIFPLDGGQMLQAAMWPRLGYYRSMLFSSKAGMVGSVAGGAFALWSGNIGLVILAVFGFINCRNLQKQLQAAGPYAFDDRADQIDLSAAYDTDPGRTRPKPQGKWASRRAAKAVEDERDEQVKIDAILSKVSAQGMQSLTWSEKRALKQATENQRRRDAEREKDLERKFRR